jgi:pyruvate dehydrogenase E1 component alpha subunit
VREHGVEQEFFDSVQQESDTLAERFRAFCLAMPEPGPERIFSEVYAEPSPQLEAEKAAYLEYHASFGGE